MKITKSQLQKIIAEELQLQEVEVQTWKGKAVAGGTILIGALLTGTGVGAVVGGPMMALGSAGLAMDKLIDRRMVKKLQLNKNTPLNERTLVELATQLYQEILQDPERKGTSGRETLGALEAVLSARLEAIPNREVYKFLESEIEEADGEESVKTAVIRALDAAKMLRPDVSDNAWRASQKVTDIARGIEDDPGKIASIPSLAKKARAIGGPGIAPWNEGKTTKITRSQLMQVINEELETTLDELGNYSQAAGASLRNAQLTGKRDEDEDAEVDPYERPLESPLAEEEDDKWIQGAEKDIEKRGTEGVCTGDKFGGPTCKPGTKRYNLAKTFRKMAKDRKK